MLNINCNIFKVVGSAVRAGSVPINTITREKPVIVVLGNEGSGIRTNILNRCDVVVELGPFSHSNDVTDNVGTEASQEPGSSPNDETDNDDNNVDSSASSGIDDGVDSLNVSVAGGIILHYFLGSSR